MRICEHHCPSVLIPISGTIVLERHRRSGLYAKNEVLQASFGDFFCFGFPLFCHQAWQ